MAWSIEINSADDDSDDFNNSSTHNSHLFNFV